MKTIETDLQVSGDHRLQMTLPSTLEELQPGVYHVVMVIDERPLQPIKAQEPFKLNVFKWEGWPANCTFRREDIYEDDGR
jgi:hypothetical protein